LDLTAASLPLLLAVLSDPRTTDDKIPIIAITTNNSIRVKPFSFFIMLIIIAKIKKPAYAGFYKLNQVN
jgi:hypothetical protein